VKRGGSRCQHSGVKEKGGGIIGALMVTTPTLSKDVATVNEGDTIGLAKAAGASTSVVGVAS